MHPQQDRSGFTLVELLIVVIIPGVIAAVAIPQFTSSTEDAKLSALDITLSELRGAVEMYYHQHGAVYPGEKQSADGPPVTTAGEAATSFVDQLTKYSPVPGMSNNS